MRFISAFIAYVFINLALASPALAMQISGSVYTLTAAEAQACALSGGCVVIPVLQLQIEIARMQDAAWDEGAKSGARTGYEAGYAAAIRAKIKGSI